jgi:hypothetical protein
MKNSKKSVRMQAMALAFFRAGWRRLLLKLGLGSTGQPVWGPGAPTILGVCTHCGAVVLQGWHRQTPRGLLCQRCAGTGITD